MKWSNSILIFIGGGLVLFLPYLILGQNTPIPLADQLDSNHVWYVLLKQHSAFLASPFSEIDGFLGTQYRLSYPAGLSVISGLYFLFPPFLAFFFNKVLIYFIGFWAAWILLTDQLNFDKPLAACCALIWATSSFYPFMGGGIAALPAVAFAFNRIRTKRSTWQDWLILGLYPFYSELVLVTLFVWLVGVGALGVDFFYHKRWNRPFLESLGTLLLLMMLKDYQLILAFFSSTDFISHRTEFFFDGYIVNKVIDPFKTLAEGEYTGIMYFNGILGFTVLLLGINLRKEKIQISPYILFAIAVIMSSVASFLSLPWVPQTISSFFPDIASLSLGRLSNLVSLGLFLAFFLAIKEVSAPIRTLVLGITIVFQIALVNYEWRSVLKRLLPLQEGWSYNPSYQEVYSDSSFEKIKKSLPANYQGYIAHVNLPPAISAYHGLKTRDGYLANYKLESKQQIKKVIEAELHKDEHINALFNFWGNKAYLFNASHQEWVYPIRQMFNLNTRQLDFHWDFLKNTLNTHFILSAGSVMDSDLELIHHAKDSISCWDLYLYKIK